MKKKTPTKAKANFKIKITLANDVLEGEGETALVALRSITPPIKIFTKGLIELSYAGKHMEQIWNPSKVRNLFRKITQPILAKQFTYLLR